MSVNVYPPVCKYIVMSVYINKMSGLENVLAKLISVSIQYRTGKIQGCRVSLEIQGCRVSLEIQGCRVSHEIQGCRVSHEIHG